MDGWPNLAQAWTVVHGWLKTGKLGLEFDTSACLLMDGQDLYLTIDASRYIAKPSDAASSCRAKTEGKNPDSATRKGEATSWGYPVQEVSGRQALLRFYS